MEWSYLYLAAPPLVAGIAAFIASSAVKRSAARIDRMQAAYDRQQLSADAQANDRPTTADVTDENAPPSSDTQTSFRPSKDDDFDRAKRRWYEASLKAREWIDKVHEVRRQVGPEVLRSAEENQQLSDVMSQAHVWIAEAQAAQRVLASDFPESGEIADDRFANFAYGPDWGGSGPLPSLEPENLEDLKFTGDIWAELQRSLERDDAPGDQTQTGDKRKRAGPSGG